MAKKVKKTRKVTEKKGTNWLVIGIIVGVGIIGLFALLMFSLFGETSNSSTSYAEGLALTDYCDQNEDRCVSIGNSEAAVKFVEISDFGCPHCRDFHQEKASTIFEQYVDTNQVEWVVLPYALREETIPAANAALCAEEQGSYYEFSEVLFNMPTVEESLTRDGFFTAGNEVGLEMVPFTECVQDGRYNNIIRGNQQAARDAGVSATPTFFINGEVIRGNVPLSEFQRLFNASLQDS